MSPTDYHFCVVDADSESHECWGLAFDGHNQRGGASKGFDSQAIKFASSVYQGPFKCNKLKGCSFAGAALMSSTLTVSYSSAQTLTV